MEEDATKKARQKAALPKLDSPPASFCSLAFPLSPENQILHKCVMRRDQSLCECLNTSPLLRILLLQIPPSQVTFSRMSLVHPSNLILMNGPHMNA
ncbi:MAG: hypothetical protein RI897_1109 [Verrucomicrobiota bacterium]